MRNGLGLNRRGLCIASLGDGAQKGFGQPKVGKRNDGSQRVLQRRPIARRREIPIQADDAYGVEENKKSLLLRACRLVRTLKNGILQAYGAAVISLNAISVENAYETPVPAVFRPASSNSVGLWLQRDPTS